MYIFTNPSTRAGCDCLTEAEEPNLHYLPIAGGRRGFIPFPRVFVLCEMQSASSRIWTRVAAFISNDDNHYTTDNTFFKWCILNTYWSITVYAIWYIYSRAGSKEFPDSLSPSFLGCILCQHRSDVSFCRSVNTSMLMCRDPLENVIHEFVLTSPAVPCMSCLYYLNDLWGGRPVAL